MSSSDTGPVLETPWDSVSEADAAVQNYYVDDGGGGDGGGSPNSPSEMYGDHSSLGGRLDVPSSLEVGAPFTADATVRNETDSDVYGNFILAGVDQQNQTVRLDSVPLTVSAGETVDVEFVVPKGSLQLVPGDATFGVIGMTNAGDGVVAEDNARITAPGEAEEAEEAEEAREWGEPYFVQELAFGWNLYAEDHLEDDRTRYMVAAKDSDGATIYLTKAGGISSQRVYFSNVDDIVTALQRYSERYESGEFDEGEAPDPSQPRPTPEEILSSGTPQGFAGAVLGEFGRRGLWAGIALGLILLGRYLHRTGRINAKQRRYLTIGAATGGLAIALEFDWSTVGLGAVSAIVAYGLYRRYT